jgi:transglutaminase-like putative cysteine protease
MHIQILHETVYRYAQPIKGAIQMLRLTPRHHDGQYVLNWRIGVSESCQLQEHENAFGNIIHVLMAEGPPSELRILVEGEVETQDTHGVIKGEVERIPPRLFLRETPLTQSDPAIVEIATLANEAAGGDVLGTLHVLLERLHDQLTYDGDAALAPALTAPEALALKRDACQDFTHIFVVAARSLSIPARCVGGHFHRRKPAPGSLPDTPGRKPSFPISVGWPSTRLTGFAPPMPTCGWRRGWMCLEQRQSEAANLAVATAQPTSSFASAIRYRRRRVEAQGHRHSTA